MRSGAAAGHTGYFHETGFYGSDRELLHMVVPFVEEGEAAGEPTIVAFGRRNTDLVRPALAHLDGVVFIAGEQKYSRPASAIRSYRELLTRLVAAGAGQVRIVGDVPHPGTGSPWHGWRRYEAAVNHAYDDFPLWGVCPYDLRVTPPQVLEEVARAHPRLVTVDGRHVANPAFADPLELLTGPSSPEPDPLEETAPDVELADPSPATARQAVHRLGEASALPGVDVEGLVVAVSEGVTNAVVHGEPPVLLRAWAGTDRLVATVRDAGAGPRHPFVGLVPLEEGVSGGGLGLWLAHQLCDEVALRSDAEGFTLRLVSGTPHVPPVVPV